jgi:hypothetical protein
VEHGDRLVAGELHDDRGGSPRLPHVGIEGVAEIMEMVKLPKKYKLWISFSGGRSISWIEFADYRQANGEDSPTFLLFLSNKFSNSILKFGEII